MAVDAGFALFDRDRMLLTGFRSLCQNIHRFIVVAGTAGRRIALLQPIPDALGHRQFMRLVFFRGVDFAGHFTPDIFQGANFGQHIIDRLMRNVAIGALGANTFIVLEMHAALIFRQRLLHGMT